MAGLNPQAYKMALGVGAVKKDPRWNPIEMPQQENTGGGMVDSAPPSYRNQNVMNMNIGNMGQSGEDRGRMSGYNPVPPRMNPMSTQRPGFWGGYNRASQAIQPMAYQSLLNSLMGGQFASPLYNERARRGW